jgi:hypothetical protein
VTHRGTRRIPAMGRVVPASRGDIKKDIIPHALNVVAANMSHFTIVFIVTSLYPVTFWS